MQEASVLLLQFVSPEISKTQEHVRLSDLAGEVELTEGVIAAKRHVHMTPEDAEKAGVADKQIVELAIESPNGRSLTFGDVVVRVSASYATAAHIDTDEANALAPGKECFGEMIIK